MKKCRYCGFKNPNEASNCLQCNRSLPMTIKEAKEVFGVLSDIKEGNVSKAGKKVMEGVVEDKVNDLKIKANPLWFLKVKLFRFKQSCISCIIILGIILFLALLGGILNKFK